MSRPCNVLPLSAFSSSCPSPEPLGRGKAQPVRRGLTLLELLVAIAIMVLVMGSLGALVNAVQDGATYSESFGTATQHARVAMQRIATSVAGATASDDFPAFLVLEDNESGWEFPDTLVVWHPDGTAVDPDGLPRISELRVYCPNPDAPNELLEITSPTDHRVAPAFSDTAGWTSEVDGLKSSNRVIRTKLTDLLRTAAVSSVANSRRGVVRFQARYRPSEDELPPGGLPTNDWDDLAWPQGIYSENSGLRQAWLSMELQLVPQSTSSGLGYSDRTAVPFLGSASRLFEVHP